MRVERVRNVFMTLSLCAAASVLLAQDSPEEAFLLYLSDYQKVDGEWVDPAEFAQQLEQMASIGKSAIDKPNMGKTEKNSGKNSAEVKDEKRG